MAQQETLNGQLNRIVDEIVRHGLTLEQARREFERQLIRASLRNHQGNIGRCAKALGIHRNTLRNKVSTLGIEAQEARPGEGRRPARRRTLRP